MNVLRPALLTSLLGTALAARANFINFDNLPTTTNTGVSVGNSYLASDGVSFLNGTALQSATAPSAPNALFPDTTVLTINSPVNVLVASLGFSYFSNTLASGTTTTTPSVSIYTGTNGAGTLLGTLLLPDTFNVFTTASLPFVGSARSFVFNNVTSSHIVYDNLSFTSQVQATPEPATFAALGLGAVAMLRRRREA